jgi:DNA-binding transcriptional ArsR family regulator
MCHDVSISDCGLAHMYPRRRDTNGSRVSLRSRSKYPGERMIMSVTRVASQEEELPRIAVEMAELASLVGDVSRAKILAALMDGRALTALELSLTARVTPQTTSSHLAKLLAANLLAVEKQGRHRYYRLASPQVAQTLETIMALTAHGPVRHRAKSKLDDDLRVARMCYDHVAGQIGVGISDALIDRGHIVFEGDAGEVTESGQKSFASLGIDLMGPTKSRRIFCRPCLDWSERRPHLAGHVGAQIAKFCLEQSLLARKNESRALTITPPGIKGLQRIFGADVGNFSL